MLDNLNFITIWEGDNTIIKAVQVDDDCAVQSFLSGLVEQDEKKVGTLFRLFDIQKGRITNNKKLKKLHFTCAGCFEFKPTKQVRIAFVYLMEPGSYIYVCLLHGFVKKQDKWPKNEIKKTEKICKVVRQYENNKRKEQ